MPGRLAVEDVCVLRQPGNGADRDLLAALEDHWKSYLLPLDGDGGWKELIEGCDLAITLVDDCSADLLGHFLQLKEGATRPEAAAVSQFEQDAWRLAIESAEAGLIGYFRLVAGNTRRGPPVEGVAEEVMPERPERALQYQRTLRPSIRVAVFGSLRSSRQVGWVKWMTESPL